MSIKKYLFSFLLVFSVSAFAQSWQSKPVVRIEDAGQSFLYTFNDSSNAYINKCNVSYIVNLPNSQWVQVGYQYDGSTSRIITASYSAIIQPDLGSAKELSDTLNAWLRDCASASGIPSGLADSLSDIRRYVDSLVFFYPDSSTITQYDVINSLNTPPGSPVTGDTYLVGNSPTGAWVGHAKDIAEWNGSAWVFTDAVQGDFLYNATNLFTYIFRNGNWVQTSGIPALNNGNTISSGLKIGTDNARSLTFETNNVNRGRIDSIGRFHIYNLPTSATADSFVILGNTLGNFTKQGKSTFLDGIGGGGGAQYGGNNTLYVSKQGNNATGTKGDRSKPYLTIQAAINAAVGGDVVLVMEGTYVENVALKDYVKLISETWGAATIQHDTITNSWGISSPDLTVLGSGVYNEIFITGFRITNPQMEPTIKIKAKNLNVKLAYLEVKSKNVSYQSKIQLYPSSTSVGVFECDVVDINSISNTTQFGFDGAASDVIGAVYAVPTCHIKVCNFTEITTQPQDYIGWQVS